LAEKGDAAAAGAWADRALEHGDQLASRTGAPIGTEQADALWLAGELSVLRDAPVRAPVSKRLAKMLDAMAAADDRMWRVYQRWFEICLALEGAP
jgi:hypothetical protein